MSAATREAMKSVVDVYGDHFVRPTTVTELKGVFERVRRRRCGGIVWPFRVPVHVMRFGMCRLLVDDLV